MNKEFGHIGRWRHENSYGMSWHEQREGRAQRRMLASLRASPIRKMVVVKVMAEKSLAVPDRKGLHPCVDSRKAWQQHCPHVNQLL